MAEFTKARIAQTIFNEKRFVCRLSLTNPYLKSNFANVKKSPDCRSDGNDYIVVQTEFAAGYIP